MRTNHPLARLAILAALGSAAAAAQAPPAAAQASGAGAPAAAASAPDPSAQQPAGAPPARPGSAQLLAIRGAHLHPVVGPDLPSATVLVKDGKIAALGQDLAIPADAAVFDASGLHLYPGFIDADTSLGLIEIPTVRGTVDTDETGRVNPHERAEVAVHAASALIPVARSAGVLTALVIPGGDLLGGSAALMNLDGWTWEEMLVKSRVGVPLRFPFIRTPPPWAREQKSEEERKKERDKQLKELDRVFDDAEAYHKARSAPAPAAQPVASDPRLEALGPVLRGEVPLIVAASNLPAIKAAVEWSEKRKLRIILRGAADAWRIAPELAKKQIGVLLQDTLSLPEREDEPYDTPFTAPRLLHEAGVPFALTSGGEASLVANLPYRAAMAAAYGLDRRVALEAITIRPARLLGVDARLGSIEPGKDANLLLTDGDPLEIPTHVVGAWIRGRPVDLRNKHLQLYELYRTRPRSR